MKLKNFFKNATVKNAGWIIAGKIVQMILSLFVGLLSARYLGPSNYGLINYASAYTAFFTSLCTLGLNSILVKEIVDNPDEQGEIIGSTLLLRFVASLMSVISIIALVSIIDKDEPITIAVVALSSIGLVFHIFEAISFWFQSKLLSKNSAIASVIAYVITSAYKITLLILRKSVEWFAFSLSIDYLCVGILLFVFYKKHKGPKLRFSWKTSKRLLKSSYHFILPGIMVAIYGYTDKFMLKQMLDEASVGYYATATAICAMWTFVLSAIIDSVYPSIMQANKERKEAEESAGEANLPLYSEKNLLFEKRNKQLYAIVIYISFGVSIFFCVFARLIISILYGEAYLPAVGPFRVVTWYTAFSYLGVARNAWIVCENKQKYLKYIYISAALSNIVMNLIFIPWLGATGAAIASLVTQIITTLVIPFFIKPLRKNSILMVESLLLKGIK